MSSNRLRNKRFEQDRAATAQTNRLSIAVITQYYPPEPVHISHAVAHGLAERGHEVRVVTGFPNYPDGHLMPGYRQRWGLLEQDGDVLVRRVPIVVSHSRNAIGRVLNYLSFGWSSLAAWRFVRHADVVYVYGAQMTAAIGPSFWHSLSKKPYVLHVQDLWPESVTDSSMIRGRQVQRFVAAVLNPWLRVLYRRAAATIALGDGMARLLADRGVPEGRLHTLLNWAEEGSIASPGHRVKERSEGGLNVMYAGNIGELQDLETVIRAASLVRDLPNFRVTFVGSGVAEKRIRRLAKELNAANVEFLGRIAQKDMGTQYLNSDFQLVTLRNLPFFQATIPSKLQSSLANGIPVITTVAGDVSDLVRDNQVGLTSASEDPEALATAFRLASALTGDERAAMGDRARVLYRDSMSKAHGLDVIEGILVAAAEKSARKEQK